jgi:hypothetical protein
VPGAAIPGLSFPPPGDSIKLSLQLVHFCHRGLVHSNQCAGAKFTNDGETNIARRNTWKEFEYMYLTIYSANLMFETIVRSVFFSIFCLHVDIGIYSSMLRCWLFVMFGGQLICTSLSLLFLVFSHVYIVVLFGKLFGS